MLLYLLDANVLITAHNTYYPIDSVPEYWEWLLDQSQRGNVKMPTEILEEILTGPKDDQLIAWLRSNDNLQSLTLVAEIDPGLIRRVVSEGYAPDLTDIELEAIGRDPFLVTYAIAHQPCSVVTLEVSKPSRTRHNRKLPDVCQQFSVNWCSPFYLNRALGFRTAWRSASLD